jgi:hypothetical protein
LKYQWQEWIIRKVWTLEILHSAQNDKCAAVTMSGAKGLEYIAFGLAGNSDEPGIYIFILLFYDSCSNFYR